MRWFFRFFTEIVSKELITRCFLVHLCSSLFIPFTRYDSLSGSTVLRPSLKLHSHIFPQFDSVVFGQFCGGMRTTLKSWPFWSVAVVSIWVVGVSNLESPTLIVLITFPVGKTVWGYAHFETSTIYHLNSQALASAVPLWLCVAGDRNTGCQGWVLVVSNSKAAYTAPFRGIDTQF